MFKPPPEGLPFKAIYMNRKKKYEVVAEIGRGTFAQIVSIKKADGTLMAAKVQDAGQTKENEIKEWPKLKHPNVVPLTELIRQEDKDIFIMPHYLFTLNEMISDEEFQQEKNSFTKTKCWLRDVAQGLDYLHRSKLCHLDLKNNNVLLTEDMSAVIGDFGFLNTTKKPVSRYGLPTPFCPPEAWYARAFCDAPEVDGVSFDIWAYGVLALYCWTLHDPNDGLLGIQNWRREQFPLFSKVLEMSAFKDLLSRAHPNSEIAETDCELALNFVQGILRMDPMDRPLAFMILDHSIMPEKRRGGQFDPDEVWQPREIVEDEEILQRKCSRCADSTNPLP